MSDEKDEKWEMPKPVFRSSTGSLPRSFEETISHSFMPNGETIEFDEDEDILSIMGPPDKDQEAGMSEFPEGEEPIEIGSDIFLETEAEAKKDTETRDTDHNPIKVTAKDPVDEVKSNSGSPKSYLFVYVLIALIVLVIIAAAIYYQP